MSGYLATEKDYDLLLQGTIKTYSKIEILNQDGTVYGELVGQINGGTANIDATSHARRSISFTLAPTEQSIDISEKCLIWINKEVSLSIGIYSILEEKYYWYPFGKFVFSNTNGNYDAINNTLSINCIDYFAKIDGTQNGQFGSVLKIPAYEEDINGDPISYNTISDCVRIIINQIGKINKYNIDDIGEYMAMPKYNSNWKSYRTTHPDWNYMPFDEEFSRGDTVSTMLDKPINLYPNYDYSFDEYGVFNVSMIPSSYDDPISIRYDRIKKMLVADGTESSSISLDSVRNICEVWGQVIDADFYSTSVTTSSSVYSATVSSYTSYSNGDKIGVYVPTTSISNMSLKVNSLSAIPIYDDGTDLPITAGTLKANNTYVLKYRNVYYGGVTTGRFYLLGQWEVHALNVLTDGTVIDDGYTDSNGNVYDKYSKEYFQSVYNCNNVKLEVIEDSPFTVQKIGERLDTKTGSDYENIESDSLAQIKAKYINWQNCRLTDSITIKTILIPWIREYQKIEYKRANNDEINTYITQQISHDFSTFTSTITMYRFYPLYQES